MGVEQGPGPFKQLPIDELISRRQLGVYIPDGFQPEVNNETVQTGGSGEESGAQKKEEQRFTIKDIATALGLTITSKNLALVRIELREVVECDPTITIYRIVAKGSRGRPRIVLTEENYNKAVQAIREQKGRETKERRGRVRVPSHKSSVIGTQTSQGLGAIGQRAGGVQAETTGGSQDDIEGEEKRERTRAEEATRRAKRQLGLNLTSTILSLLAADALDKCEKNFIELMVARLPSGVNFDTVIGSNLAKDFRDFFIGLLAKTVEEFWGVTRINQVTAAGEKIAECVIQLRSKGYDVKGIVAIVGGHFSIQIPDEYNDERIVPGVTQQDSNNDGNRAQNGGQRETNWDRLGKRSGLREYPAQYLNPQPPRGRDRRTYRS